MKRIKIILLIIAILLILVALFLLWVAREGIIKNGALITYATELIGIVLTVFVIERILKMEKRKQQKPIRNTVKKNLRDRVEALFSSICSLLGEQPNAITQEAFREKLEELSENKESITLPPSTKEEMKEGTFYNLVYRSKKYLEEIEEKHSSYLNSDITDFLAETQRNLEKFHNSASSKSLEEEPSFENLEDLLFTILEDIDRIKEEISLFEEN